MTNLAVCRIGDYGLAVFLVHANDIAGAGLDAFHATDTAANALNRHGGYPWSEFADKHSDLIGQTQVE